MCDEQHQGKRHTLSPLGSLCACGHWNVKVAVQFGQTFVAPRLTVCLLAFGVFGMLVRLARQSKKPRRQCQKEAPPGTDTKRDHGKSQCHLLRLGSSMSTRH
eukprot:4535998-Amphidinium_carterae.1